MKQSLQRQHTTDHDDAAVMSHTAPGKVTPSSQLSAPTGNVVQRKEQDSSASVRSEDEWMNDPALLAAHGMMPAGAELNQQPVQAEQGGGKKGVLGKAWKGVKKTVQGIGKGIKGVGRQLATKEFNDLDATMYRVTMEGGERKVEQIARQQDDDGKVFYVALGLVTGFSGERPVVERYDEPRHLGNWVPRVTHVNGMMVSPEGGIGSAASLHESIAKNLDGSIMPPDVLYTYSAKGGFFPDLIECVEGKLGIEDPVIQSQETQILDAVREQRRISISAHSRGTIKTDVAIRNAHAVLREEMIEELMSGPEAEQAAAEAAHMAEAMAAEGMESISPAIAGEIARQAAAKKISGKKAWQRIEQYVQLIYAGNAVKFPAPPAELVVGKGDMVSMSVGTYFQLGRDIKKFKKVSGGHGYDENYAATVGEWIAQDLMAQNQPSV